MAVGRSPLMVCAALAVCTLAAGEAVAGETVAIPGHKTTYQVLMPGKGSPVVSKGATVKVHATGVVKESGYQFWSTKDKGQSPFGYKAGVGAVIKGWDQGCLGMEIGEVRQLTIPFDEGYGDRGFPAWKIPPKATLSFEIEVLSIDGVTQPKSEL